ncbi:MAG: hypothetical protein HY743_05060 [Deltaproteobacteria bacterium]|nr:hypothetical protein [Deltaproteobacteria bacterium]
MIPAPSAEFEAEETRRSGAKPFFRFIINPHYFRTGIAAGSGTFVNCAYQAPDRLQVNAGATSASWTSPALRATVGSFPAEFSPTWVFSSPGYDGLLLELRTAATEAGLASASWAALSQGAPVSIYEYYQWRATWLAVRCWFFDTEGEMDDAAMWFLDAYAPEDPYQSYFTDGIPGETVAYLEAVRFAGEYLLPSADVKQNGALTLDAKEYFADLAAADHTLVLLNRDKRYSPRHANFIFAGETHWYKKRLRIEFGYEWPNGQLTDTIVLYEGVILRWGPAPHGVDQGGKFGEHVVEIYSRDEVADLLEQKVGQPAEDGAPQPMVFGEVLRQAEQLGDETLGDPNRTADFEDGTTGELTGVDAGGDGAVAVVTT